MTRLVRELFPELQAEIVDLYLCDLEFRRMLHDMGVCGVEIERLTKSAASERTNERLEQFRELKSELEVEIVEHLNSTLTKPDELPPSREENHVRTDHRPS